jgi:hypothetical protein
VKVLHESALTVPIPEQEQQIEPWSVDGHHLAFDYLAISKKTWTHFWVIVDARKWNTQLRKTSSYQRPDCPERKREPHKCTMLSCVKTPIWCHESCALVRSYVFYSAYGEKISVKAPIGPFRIQQICGRGVVDSVVMRLGCDI